VCTTITASDRVSKAQLARATQTWRILVNNQNTQDMKHDWWWSDYIYIVSIEVDIGSSAVFDEVDECMEMTSCVCFVRAMSLRPQH